ncbi:hypothetical protein DEO72_LG8g1529 [Vigna unguiculata]|uniref:Uncharacterized protein n=1 Tax=Vigna unguiculata TaxID=3917 RepID=A0A4D6MRU2_VIGUN|nr:hypothetical protein DEO72_LG8g1529 [Vigna unguiculata]
MPKTSSIALLVWRLAAQGEPPGDRYLKQWQWPLDAQGAWQQGVSHQAVTKRHGFCMALGNWWCEMRARRSGTRFCLAA